MKLVETEEQTDLWNKFVLDGDLNALSKIYFQNYDVLYSYGMKISSDKQIVEDAIQNMFISVIKSRKNISEVKNLVGYLVSSFRHQLVADINSYNKTIHTEQFPENRFDYFYSPEQNISENEHFELLQKIIKQTVEKLSSKQQEMIYLRFEKGISYEEISKMFNISIDSCYKSIYRSIKTIRIEVENKLRKEGNIILWFLFKLSMQSSPKH